MAATPVGQSHTLLYSMCVSLCLYTSIYFIDTNAVCLWTTPTSVMLMCILFVCTSVMYTGIYYVEVWLPGPRVYINEGDIILSDFIADLQLWSGCWFSADNRPRVWYTILLTHCGIERSLNLSNVHIFFTSLIYTNNFE